MHISKLITGEEGQRRNLALSLSRELSSKWDVHTFESGDTNGIANIKYFVKNLYQKPFDSPLQTAIIFDAHLLTLESQNSLLKIVEEPSKTTQMILTAPSKESVLATISSRCELIQLGEEDSSVAIEETFISAEFYKRWEKAEKLQLDSWIAFWRDVFQKKVLKTNDKAGQRKVLTYLKILQKSKNLEKRRVSKKLLHSFLLLAPPIGEISEIADLGLQKKH